MAQVYNLTINDQQVKAEEGTTILDAARSIGIDIPTLCSHPLLKPLGACRLCIVEIKDGNRSLVGTSCTYLVTEGLEVKTDTPEIHEARKVLIELLLARAPKAKAIQRLAKEYGVENTRLITEDTGELCILCGLCARICDEVVGASAINFVNRGVNREIVFNPEVSSESCVGCGICTTVCPTQCLEIEKPYGVISAIAMGRKAAISIDSYLGGNGIIDEELTEFKEPDPFIGKVPDFSNRLRVLESCSLDSAAKENALFEAKRCMQCDLRLQINCIKSPPEHYLEFNAENVGKVPDVSGVFQLLDKDKKVTMIKGAMNIKEALDEAVESNNEAAWFEWEADEMFTKRESELIQQYMQKYGEMPGGGMDELDDLF